MPRIAIFASGSGSNAREIIKYFKGHQVIQVGLIVTNRQNAGVLQHAEEHNIPAIHIPKSSFKDKETLLNALKEYKIDWIILAGFLLLIPAFLIQVFSKKIINIHPSLLPKYGGKGMYGHHVHEAVKANKEKNAGLTIHYVNENFDEGEYIFQASTAIEPHWNANEIASAVLKLEHQHFAKVIEQTILDTI